MYALTPSFELYGPKKVDVVVSINKADFTITQANFCYFLNTKAEYTLVYGPGILRKNCVGVDTILII